MQFGGLHLNVMDMVMVMVSKLLWSKLTLNLPDPNNFLTLTLI